MQLIAANVTTSNTIEAERVLLSNTSLVTSNSISIGNSSLSTDEVSVGSNVYMNTSAVSAPMAAVGSVGMLGAFSGVINYQNFYANGVWYNPYANSSCNSVLTGWEEALIMMWGAGPGGYSSEGSGGSGCAMIFLPLNSLPATANVIVEPGNWGNASFSTTTYGNSIFVINATCNISVLGGNSNQGTNAWTPKVSSASYTNTTVTLSDPYTNRWDYFPSITSDGLTSDIRFYSNTYPSPVYVGGYGTNSIFGGGGGGYFGSAYASIFGGAGGAGWNYAGPVAISIFGGNGGNTTVNAESPGGGGGSSPNRKGGNGEVRVWVLGGSKGS